MTNFKPDLTQVQLVVSGRQNCFTHTELTEENATVKPHAMVCMK